MSHIHIPDGVLPVWLVLAGWAGAIIVLALAVRALGARDTRRQAPLLGVFAALMLVGMSTEFIPIGYHINLAVVSGIILGPVLSVIAAFVVDVILALFGHGGITVVGLNTLVIGAEATLGWLIFRFLYRAFARRTTSVAVVGALSTALALLCSTLLLIGIVALGSAAPDSQWHAALADSPTLEGAFSQGVLGNVLIGGGKEAPAGGEAQSMSMSAFAGLVLSLGAIGWLIEAAISAVILQFLYRVRPRLIVPEDSNAPADVG